METNERKDVYAIVTDHIMAQLEQGVVPWQQPWGTAGIPRNLLTGREYQGINIMLLNSLEYAQNLFLSFDQAKTLGGTIKKGEKAHIVVFWKLIESKEEVPEGQKKPDSKPVLRYYKVFNIEQCQGIPVDKIPKPEEKADVKPIALCETIIKNVPNPPKIKHGIDGAYYSPLLDIISMPRKGFFKRTEGYYSTLFHELVHSTGHETRLNRPGITEHTRFGTDIYSFEELVAEIGACFVCSQAGITPDYENSASYIQGWLSRLQNEKRWIITAAGQAQKAADYILNIPRRTYETTKTTEEPQSV